MFEPDSHEYNLLTKVSVDQCLKCTICETQCPVMAVTELFPGPKFVGPQAERFRDGQSVDRSLDYCSSCGTCTLVCPQQVKVAEINSVARAAMKRHHMPLRDRLISRTTAMGALMRPVAPLANAALAWRPLRVLVEQIIGLHRQAAVPRSAGRPFRSWWSHHTPSGAQDKGSVIFFHGCAGNWFEVQTAIEAVQILEHIGFRVIVPKQGCCGMACQSNGLFDDARRQVRRLAADLGQAPADLPIVSIAGSCQGMLKHEAAAILGLSDDPALQDVGQRTHDICQFLLDLAQEGKLPLDWRPNPATVVYHAPCQLKAQAMGQPAVALLRLVPDLQVVESNVTCCGIAGTYGLKKEKYDIAAAVGRPLFDLVEQVSPALVACDTETCRWQLRHHTGARVEHPIHLIHQAYGLG